MGELEKRIITTLQAFESQITYEQQVKLPREAMEKLAYHMSYIVGEMRKDFGQIFVNTLKRPNGKPDIVVAFFEDQGKAARAFVKWLGEE